MFSSCPVTGQPLDTGEEIDEASFARLPTLVGTMFCVHCSAKHDRSTDRAWIVDGDRSQS
jgi:hypothetical protein